MSTRSFSLGFLALLTGSSAQALTFNLNFDPGIDSNALAGFQAAANIWSDQFSDPITVNLNIGYTALPPGVIASASSVQTAYNYAAFRTALAIDQTSTVDVDALAGLPAGSTYGFYMNGTTTNGSVASPGAPHAQTSDLVRLTNANAKAIGLYTGNASAADATINFSSSFASSFDFNRSDGIASNRLDFIGVAAHEIGHALGFISGVDVLDGNPPTNAAPYTDASFNPFHSSMDLFKYADLPGVGATRAFLRGNTQIQFSLSTAGVAAGNPNNNPTFSTGRQFGDGQQASHWKDDLNLGIMDPTANDGELLDPVANDLKMFDAIGYDFQPVPEPASMAVVGLGLAAMKKRRRKSA